MYPGDPDIRVTCQRYLKMMRATIGKEFAKRLRKEATTEYAEGLPIVGSGFNVFGGHISALPPISAPRLGRSLALPPSLRPGSAQVGRGSCRAGVSTPTYWQQSDHSLKGSFLAILCVHCGNSPRAAVSAVTLRRRECDKIFPTVQYHRQAIECLGYDPFEDGASPDCRWAGLTAAGYSCRPTGL